MSSGPDQHLIDRYRAVEVAAQKSGYTDGSCELVKTAGWLQAQNHVLGPEHQHVLLSGPQRLGKAAVHGATQRFDARRDGPAADERGGANEVGHEAGGRRSVDLARGPLLYEAPACMTPILGVGYSGSTMVPSSLVRLKSPLGRSRAS